MARAKSRLSQKKTQGLELNLEKKPDTFSAQAIQTSTFKTIAQNYLQHLPTLFLGIIFSALTFFILTKVEPSAVQHLILPNTYLPFLASSFLASFFLTSFLLLNSRRGFFLALAITIFLFLRVQQVLIKPQILLIIISPLVILELVFSLINRKS